MMNTWTIIQVTLLKQMRRPSYLLLVAISILLGFLCVPSMSDGYQVFYLGGVRGIYNSAWLGAVAAMLPVILFWLPGFFLLRSQITQDRELQLGQSIASSPIRTLHYVINKFLANFCVLLSFSLLFLIAIVGMQLLRGESMSIQLMSYFLPLLFLTIPYLLVLAALTIVFDIVPGLKGMGGNLILFSLWLTLTSLSVGMPGRGSDLFGIGMIMDQMLAGARFFYSELPDSASFGYYPHTGSIPTYIWNGILWENGFLLDRLWWVLAAFLLVLGSGLVFDRFRTPKFRHPRQQTTQTASSMQPVNLTLSPVRQVRYANIPMMLRGELNVMFSGKSLGWYVLNLSIIALSFFVVVGDGLKWIALLLLLPVGVWSLLGCRDRIYRTLPLIHSSSSKTLKWLVSWIAGVFIGLLFSGGILLRFVYSGAIGHVVAWIAGLCFVVSLALVGGALSRSRRLFEGLLIVLLYLGPINNIGPLDFLGVQTQQPVLYLLLSSLLLGGGLLWSWLDDHRMTTLTAKER